MGNEWISIKDSLPGLDKEFQIKTIFSEYECKLALRDFDFSIVFVSNDGDQINVNHITHWRPIQEKRHDFSKLKKGDLIMLMLVDEYMLVKVDQSYIIGKTYKTEEEADKACQEYNINNPESPVGFQYIGYINF